VSKSSIEEALSEAGRTRSPNAVEALVSRTRKTLADAGSHIIIEAVRGVGYTLREEH
jgi:two-component system response regulator QseB/two-component system response regulator TctD